MNRTLLQAVCATLAAGAALGAAAAAHAAEAGTVASKTPVYTQVATPQNQCVVQEQPVARPTTGAGGLVGALVGGGIGNAFGGGAGRAAATGVGAVAGALIGNRIESDATPAATMPVQHCQVVQRTENRLVGYDVVYDYQGRRYSARLPNDPGEPGAPIALDVSVAPAGAPAAPIVANPAPVAVPVPLVAAPVYAAPVYAAPVYTAPRVSIGLGAVWGHGWGYGHWH